MTTATPRFALLMVLAAAAWAAGACADAGTPADDDQSIDTSTTTMADTSIATDTSTTTSTPDTTVATDMGVDTTPPDPMCGNDVREGTETCDGKDVGPATCETNGFDGGTLQCNAECDGYDTTLCSSSAMCGDGVAEGAEECDGNDLRGLSCETEGFAGGRLICLAGCVLERSQCTTCGNDTLDAGEACDGTELDGATCASEGFDGGTIGCSDTCALDTTTCTRDTCGNGNVDSGEDCEGSDVAGQTCRSLGFTGGALGCTSNCAFDTVGCFECGDNLVSAGETCDGTDLAGETCASQGATAGTLACAMDCQGFDLSGCSSCGDGSVAGSEDCEDGDLAGATCESLGFTFGTLACDTSCAYDTTSCQLNDDLPAAGDLVISEVMANPDVISDSDGEWFEVHNPTSGSRNLLGCFLTDGANELHIIDSDVVVTAGGYATLAATDTPGFAPDYVYTYADIKFTNSSDTLTIECPDGSGGFVVVDTISWDDGATFPQEPGFSMSLGGDYLNATDNDDGLRWCNSVIDPLDSSYDNNNFGTPGRANYACQVGYCNVQYPATIGPGGDEPALPTLVYGQVFADGLTNLSSGDDPDPRLVAELGWGPFAGDPRGNPMFTWIPATPNTGFSNGNNDEYQAELSGIAAGDYSYFYRFSYDGGVTWLYCDTNGSTPQGAPDPVFDPNDAGLLSVP